MSITFGDRLIDSGYHDITPEQEREIEAREECVCLGLDPDDDAADGVAVWMVVAKEMRERHNIAHPSQAAADMPDDCKYRSRSGYCHRCGSFLTCGEELEPRTAAGSLD
jgi:hypothetical protein